MDTATFPKRLTGEVKSLIMRAVYEVLGDPDFGLELSEKAERRLRKAGRSNSRGIPAAEIKRKYL